MQLFYKTILAAGLYSSFNLSVLATESQHLIFDISEVLQGKPRERFIGYKKHPNPQHMTSEELAKRLQNTNSQAGTLELAPNYREIFATGVYKQETAGSSIDALKNKYGQAVKSAIENTTTEGLCIKSSSDVTKLKNSPGTMYAFMAITTYNAMTTQLKDYCTQYGAPNDFINQIRSDLAARKTEADKKIIDIMGHDYLSCLNNSPEAQHVGFYAIEELRISTNTTKELFCTYLKDKEIIEPIANAFNNIFTALGF